MTNPAVERAIRRQKRPPVLESQFQDAVIDAAHRLGWTVAHFRPAKTERGWRTPVQADGTGFPDLVLMRERVIWAECKRTGEHPSAEQYFWLQGLIKAGQEVYVWDERDWPEIEATLRRQERSDSK